MMTTATAAIAAQAAELDNRVIPRAAGVGAATALLIRARCARRPSNRSRRVRLAEQDQSEPALLEGDGRSRC